MREEPKMPVGNEVFYSGLSLIGLGTYGSVASPAPMAGLYGIIFGVVACLFWWVNACEFKKKIQDEQAEAEAQLLQTTEGSTAPENPSSYPTSEVPHDGEMVAAIRWTETGEKRIIKPTARSRESIGNLKLEILEP